MPGSILGIDNHSVALAIDIAISSKVSVAIMGHLRTLQYYYSKEAYRDFNFNPDTHHLIYYKPHKNEVQRII